MGKRLIVVVEIALILSVTTLFALSCIPGANSIVLAAGQGNQSAICLILGTWLATTFFWGIIVSKAWPHTTVMVKKDGKVIYKDVKYL